MPDNRKAGGLVLPDHVEAARREDEIAAANALNKRIIIAIKAFTENQDRLIRSILYSHMGEELSALEVLESRVQLKYDAHGGFTLLLDGEPVAVFGAPDADLDKGANNYYTLHLRQRVRVVPPKREAPDA